MAGINLNKKLWRIPQQGMVRGVCAGIANYFDVPVKLVRILVVLSIFFGLALFTLVAYIILSFALDPMPDNMAFGEQLPSSSELLDEVDRELAASETRLREMERYVTSDTFTLRSRIRQQAGQKVKPGFKLAGKLVLLTALRYGPAGVAGWAIKSVARRPLKMLLAVALEPLLSRAANKLAQRYKR